MITPYYKSAEVVGYAVLINGRGGVHKEVQWISGQCYFSFLWTVLISVVSEVFLVVHLLHQGQFSSPPETNQANVKQYIYILNPLKLLLFGLESFFDGKHNTFTEPWKPIHTDRLAYLWRKWPWLGNANFWCYESAHQNV